MIPEQKSKSSQTTALAITLFVFAIIVGLYYSLRYGGWAMEDDTSSQTTAAIGTIESGLLDNTSSYNNGYGYAAELAVLQMVSELRVQDIQLGSSLWVFVLALVAFITYREYAESAAVAALGVLFLFLQPDFLFYIVRGGHEKYTWTCALLMLFLLRRSYQHINKPVKLLIFVGLFYITYWAFLANNVYFAATFMGAILLSFIGGWALNRLGARKRPEEIKKTRTLQRLIIISLACFILVFIFISYAYQPALQFYSIFSSLSDKISILLLGTQPAGAPQSYQVFSVAWRSQTAYLMLTGLQWLIGIISLVAWGIGLRGFSKLDQKHWLMWLMYSAFGVILIIGIVADFAGFMNTNLQLRMFTPFALFSSPLAAGLVAQGVQALAIQRRRLVVMAYAAVVLVVIFGAAVVVLKVTNDPIVGNQWLFYTPAELAPASWMDKNGIQRQQVWIDTWTHLPTAYYFWQGFRPLIPSQYLWGQLQSTAPYTLISELTRLRANRSGISLPETDDQNRVYDNGQVQIYHRLALTPYQR